MDVLNYVYAETDNKDNYPDVDECGNDISMYEWEFWGMRKTLTEEKAVWRRDADVYGEVTQ